MKKNVFVFLFTGFVLLTNIPGVMGNDLQSGVHRGYDNIAYGKSVKASSSFSADFPVEATVDGKYTSVWGSGTDKPTEWIYIDLGKSTRIDGIGLIWYEQFYAKQYQVAISHDAVNWTFVFNQKNGLGGDERLYGTGNCRFIGILLTQKNSVAFALKEFEVYVAVPTSTPSPTPTATPTAVNTPTSTFTPTPIPIVTPIPGQNGSYFRVNLLGYLPGDKKIGIIGTEHNLENQSFYVVDAFNTADIKFTGVIGANRGNIDTPFNYNYPCDFSSVVTKGYYRLKLADGTLSDAFAVGALPEYKNALASVLQFFRSQRCGDTDPVLHNPCHLNDSLHMDTKGIDPAGGWHDAGDYIKYMITVTFATYELIAAADYAVSYDLEDALVDVSPANGIPDLIEEARVGLQWIMNMTDDYQQGNYYYQVSGSEDHNYWRRPEDDDVTGKVGNPRSLHKGWGGNLLGRSAASLAVANRVFKAYDGDFAAACLARAEALFADRENYKKSQHSNPTSYYSEGSWLDDMVLGAAELYHTTKNETYATYAQSNVTNLKYGGLGWSTCNYLAYAACYRAGIETVEMDKRMKDELLYRRSLSDENVYYLSSGYGWGTSAFYTADAQKVIMYYYLTGDNSFLDIADAQRDFLLGRNNWGITFITGVGIRSPEAPHSQLDDLIGPHIGAVVGGPANKSSWDYIFPKGLGGIDIYEDFQSSVVYYDKKADYYCNEVAIDYAAPSVFIFIHTVAQALKK